ncbi:MAG: GrpE protein [Bacteroidetes bacterium]|jgi:molecular chaperone GrpE|nr:GrpE protein [Bacteroidota bacterium]
MTDKDNSVKEENSENKVNQDGADNTSETPETTAENAENKGSGSKTTDLEQKVNDLNDKYLRLYSEFDNYRKRTIKEKSDIIKSAGEDIFKALLPVIDDFERAMKANEKIDDVNAIKEGIQLIYNKLKGNVQSRGLTAFETIGTAFDSDTMEAITHIPAVDESQKGKVIDEVEKGYKLGDKVIRFAKVVIAQ